jgi:hypothetical protein
LWEGILSGRGAAIPTESIPRLPVQVDARAGSFPYWKVAFVGELKNSNSTRRLASEHELLQCGERSGEGGKTNGNLRQTCGPVNENARISHEKSRTTSDAPDGVDQNDAHRVVIPNSRRK